MRSRFTWSASWSRQKFCDHKLKSTQFICNCHASQKEDGLSSRWTEVCWGVNNLCVLFLTDKFLRKSTECVNNKEEADQRQWHSERISAPHQQEKQKRAYCRREIASKGAENTENTTWRKFFRLSEVECWVDLSWRVDEWTKKSHSVWGEGWIKKPLLRRRSQRINRRMTTWKEGKGKEGECSFLLTLTMLMNRRKGKKGKRSVSPDPYAHLVKDVPFNQPVQAPPNLTAPNRATKSSLPNTLSAARKALLESQRQDIITQYRRRMQGN